MKHNVKGLPKPRTKENKTVKILRDYQAVFKTPSGKVVLHDLMREHHMLSPSYVVGDPHESAKREGERAVILHILQYLNYNLNDLEQAIEEANNDGTIDS